ncbi:MAG: type II secretion system protein [Parcubacteria group bacterium]
MIKIKDKQKGFTLIELLVSMTILIIILTVMSSAFIQSMKVQRSAMNFQQVEENVSFLTEVITKEIRVSTIATRADGCYITLNIEHPIHGTVGYGLQGTDIVRTTDTGSDIINSNAVEFSNLEFCNQGAEVSDDEQPRVSIHTTVRSKEINEQAELDLQTTISLRFLDDEGLSPF